MDILDATIEDLKACRPDLCKLLYEEFKKAPKKPRAPKVYKPRKNVRRVLEIGERVKWLPTGEIGTIVSLEGFGYGQASCRVIVDLPDGRQGQWYDNPKLLIEVK